jgi:hypothetical protein
VLLAERNSDEEINKVEMGGACGTYGMEENFIQGLVGKPN